MNRIADVIVNYRKIIAVTLFAITGIFAWLAVGIKFDANFAELQPRDHPFIQVNNQYSEQYGSPLTIFMMLRLRGEGDIYNRETLEKVKELTRALDALPGVNHDQVISIASRKIKVLDTSGSYVRVNRLMPHVMPATEDEFRAFRSDVSDAGVMGTLVSRDGKSTLLSANFIEKLFQQDDIFERLRELKAQYSDDKYEIFLAGQPMLMGWVDNFMPEILTIIIATITLMFILLYLHMRNLSLTILPLIGTAMAAIWGVGFAAAFGWNLNPLILIIPVLLMSRSLSHSVQNMERMVELQDQEELGPQDKGRILIRKLFIPGTLGIVTDALGILVISVTSITVLNHLAGFGSFWSLSNLLTVTILIAVMVSIFGGGGSKQVKIRLDKGRLTAFLSWLGRFISAHSSHILLAFLAVVVFTISVSTQIRVGDINPGTPVLWPDSDYNVAVSQINSSFVGTNEFQVIIETEKPEPGLREPSVLAKVRDFQRHMEVIPEVKGSRSFADLLPIVQRRLSGNYVKWQRLPDKPRDAAQFSALLLRGSDPGDFSRFVSDDYGTAAVTLILKDQRGETLEKVVTRIRDYLATNNLDGDDYPKFRLASSLGGVVSAINEEVSFKYPLILSLITTVIFVLCLWAFSSWFAAGILVAPLLTTNFVVFSVMVFMGVGIDVNTLPVISIGMGMGIDYGIYLLTRILQEHRESGTYEEAVATALRSTGRAILFTASVMIIGSSLWYFLSSFRFLAEMGLLLSLVVGFNLIGALLVIPAAIIFFKPTFSKEARVLRWG